MGHGSQLEYKSQPSKLNVFNFLHACLIAVISPCAVGSFSQITTTKDYLHLEENHTGRLSR